jgi:hypothetical protein
LAIFFAAGRLVVFVVLVRAAIVLLVVVFRGLVLVAIAELLVRKTPAGVA